MATNYKGTPGPHMYVAGRVRGQPRPHKQDWKLGIETAKVRDTIAHISMLSSAQQQDADGRAMAAAWDFLDALTGAAEPDLWRIRWLGDLLDLVDTEGGADRLAEAMAEDPESVNEMLSNLRELVRLATAAIAKARGEMP